MTRRLPLLLALLLAALAGASMTQAAVFSKSPERAAEDAERQGMLAVTIWVEATWGFRKQGAANDLSAAHRAFTARGYRVASVEPYIENGDLQGFFVTYQKP
jgi:hypothetical protein